MTRSRYPLHLLVVLACLAGAALLRVPAAGAQPPGGTPEAALRVDAVDVSGYPDVSLTVNWPAPPASPAGALPAAEVREGGDLRPAQLTPLAGEDLAVALVVDTSGSMAGAPLEAAKAAASTFLSALPAQARVAVVGFGAVPRVASPLTGDHAALSAALAGLVAEGETALYDAVAVGLQQLPPGTAARRHVVVLSDGGDTASATGIDAVAAHVTASGVGAHVVELATADSNHAALEQLARAGGGGVVAASDPGGLTAVYESLARGLARQYRVEFRAQGRGSTPVEVSLSQPGGTASARLDVELPAAPPATSAAPSSVPTSAASRPASPATSTSPATASSWLLALGAVLCYAALLLLLAPLGRRRRTVALDPYRSTRRTPKGSTMARVAERVTAVTDQALEGHERRSRLNEALDRAGLALRPAEFVVLAGCSAVTGLAVGLVAAGPVAGLLFGAVPLLSARLLLGALEARRQRRFAAQLGDVLQLIASTLRAGHGVLQALDVVGQEAEAPARDEFRRIVVEARLGRSVEEALRAAGDRMGGEDFVWVAQAIAINREVGGDLADVLDTIAATMRERDRIRRQVRALSAEGRLSAYVLVGLPIGLAAVTSAVNPGYLAPLTHGAGLVLALLGVGMLAAGSIWLRRMVDVEY